MKNEIYRMFMDKKPVDKKPVYKCTGPDTVIDDPRDVRIRQLETALRHIERHHIALNILAGRDIKRSTTLRLVREGLDPNKNWKEL